MDATTMKRPQVGGVVGFVMGLLQRGRTGLRAGRVEKRMKLVETLSLGGKRQLMLVECDGQKYLVGAGVDGAQTIVAVGVDEVRR